MAGLAPASRLPCRSHAQYAALLRPTGIHTGGQYLQQFGLEPFAQGKMSVARKFVQMRNQAAQQIMAVFDYLLGIFAFAGVVDILIDETSSV